MSTPAEDIDRIAASLPEQLTGDAYQRSAALRDVAEATARLSVNAATLYGQAVKALVTEVGATEAARKLGLSRNRVYQIAKHA